MAAVFDCANSPIMAVDATTLNKFEDLFFSMQQTRI